MPQDPDLTVGLIALNPRDGAAVVWVSPGEFTLGGDLGPFADRHRGLRVTIASGYWLYRCPVTNAQYRRFVDATGGRPSRYGDEDRFNAPRQPVVGVNWDDMRAYCDWAGARLPSEAEWEYAARGPAGCRYPWGDAAPDETRAIFGQDWCTGGTAEVGGRPAGASWCGALDLAGNVWERCRDVWRDEADPGSLDGAPVPPDPWDGTRVVRGGSWNSRIECMEGAYRFKLFDCTVGSLGFRPIATAPVEIPGADVEGA